MVNRIFRGGEAAVASIDVEGEASDELSGRTRRDPPRAGRLGGDDGRGRRASMNTVRLFPARVVRQEWARRPYGSLAESVDESGIDLYGVAIDPAAY